LRPSAAPSTGTRTFVVATGIYAFLELTDFLATRADDVITGWFVRELREGIDDTGVRAAFLKCAVEHHGIIGDVPRILGCIASAAVETGAPVMVHTNADALQPDARSHPHPPRPHRRGLHRSHPPLHGRRLLLRLHGAQPVLRRRAPRLLRISKSLLPALRDGGVTEAQIAQMMVETPRRFLAGV
jgi:predicted metal-dependent phosphotriesterase family hydrolase